MSTRCCIKVIQKLGKKKAEVMLYHHHDGYPEGVGADLVNRSKDFGKAEGKWFIDDVVNSLVKDINDEYEVTLYNHVDIEYLYTIDCNKMSIKCNECVWIFEDENGNLVNENVVGKEVQIQGDGE